MRRIKVLGDAPGTYHVISRVVAGERLLEPADREVLRKQMRRMAEFCGVEVLTYCILSNHFHLLVTVPPRPELSDQELVRRYAVLYGTAKAKVLEQNLQAPGKREGLRAELLKRMHDISFFMKELKLRFTLYYNRTHGRFGTFWAEKFKSLLVEHDGDREAILMVAAYIDLNPVRAGLCQDPKDYRFSGYGEAMGGSKVARDGLAGIVSGRRWSEISRNYRMVLFGNGVESDRSREGGIDPTESQKVLEAGGKLPLRELLLLRVRYFSEGVALGSAKFIQQLRADHPEFRKAKRFSSPPAAPVEGGPDLYFARPQRRTPAHSSPADR